jgi:tRNA 2-thiouridine synthesizing protein E
MNATNTAHIRLDSLLNPDGFLYNPQTWTRAIASAIAHQDGLPELTHDHWVIICELRDHYQKFGAALPALSHICRKHHLGKYCVDRLFRSEREAWRIAGMPDPGEEANTYYVGTGKTIPIWR